MGWYPAQLERILSYLKSVSRSEGAAGLLIFSTTLGLLLFVSASYFVGFLLGAPSHHLFEKWLNGIWQRIETNALFKSFGAEEEQLKQFQKLFKAHFGFEIPPTGQRITNCSWLCAYFVWANSPDLGQMTSRWDAEALESRAILFASVILTLLRALEQLYTYCRFGNFHYGWLSTFGLISVAAGSAYGFHRRKQVYGRCALFHSLCSSAKTL